MQTSVATGVNDKRGRELEVKLGGKEGESVMKPERGEKEAWGLRRNLRRNKKEAGKEEIVYFVRRRNTPSNPHHIQRPAKSKKRPEHFFSLRNHINM